jgi:Holliday junction resolvase RusA-like endonuclease
MIMSTSEEIACLPTTSRQVDLGLKNRKESPPHSSLGCIHFTIEIDPIPKARMTRYGKNTRQARRTLSYQEALAWELRKQLTEIRGQGSAVPRSLFPDPCLLELSAIFSVTHNRRADLDNYLKALKDALKWAGIIKDDSQIIAYGPCKLVRKAARGSVSINLKAIDLVNIQISNNANNINQK